MDAEIPDGFDTAGMYILRHLGDCVEIDLPPGFCALKIDRERGVSREGPDEPGLYGVTADLLEDGSAPTFPLAIVVVRAEHAEMFLTMSAGVINVIIDTCGALTEQKPASVH